ncbi:MAG: heme o synthase [Nitrososphaeria archaeon]|nr:heme o synthase [Nitrososphaeria archaeon]
MKVEYLVDRLRVYYSVTKPRIWYLLAYTAFGGYIAGSSGEVDWIRALIATLSVVLASAGSEAVANFIERDIDALMERTKNRPLPSGKIKPERNALILGLILIGVGVASAYSINLLALLFILIGVLDYVVVYVMLSKKKTPLNVILGSAAGGAPTMVGYVSAANHITLDSLILAAIVVLWIPSHIWSLALRYREDYMKAGIPMLPVVVSREKAIRCISSTSILLVVFSILVSFINPALYGPVYLVPVSISGAVLLYLSLKLMKTPEPRLAWKLFKFTSPHLAIIFTSIIISIFVR